jgi:hypothetical protein
MDMSGQLAFPWIPLDYTSQSETVTEELWSWIPWDSDLRKAALTMPSKNWKLHTRLLVTEGSPRQQIRNCLKIIKERRRKIGGPPLRSSGQNSWLQIQRSGFDSRRYQIFWEVVGLERGSPSLVSTIEELPEIKSSGSGLEKPRIRS